MSTSSVQRAAMHVWRRFGPSAPFKAVERAHMLHDHGLIDRCELWISIFWAIRQLEHQERPRKKTLH
jgi:hypothetical protein